MSSHLTATDLLYTVNRIALLKERIEHAKRTRQDYEVDSLELVELTEKLEAHPIRPYIHFENKSPLALLTLDPVGHSRCAGYWYAIQHEGRAHVAFRSRDALMRWLQERGLRLTAALPEQGTYCFQKLSGSYRESVHTSYDLFYSLIGVRTRVMSNGSYTMGIINQDDSGIRTVHTLNVNCVERPVYDRADCLEFE